MRMSNEPPETSAGPTVFFLTKYKLYHGVISTVFSPVALRFEKLLLVSSCGPGVYAHLICTDKWFMRISNEPLGDLHRAQIDVLSYPGIFLNLVNLKIFSIQSPNLNTILFEVSLIKIYIIQAAVVIIRKMYLVQNDKKSMKILGLSRHGLFCQKLFWAGCIFLIL